MDIIYDGGTVGLLTTYRCNLKCAYCYISQKQDLDMPLELAQTILEPILSHAGGHIEVELMGAEPLMAEPLIRALVEWTESRHWNRSFHFFGCTNGTLLTEDMKQWLTVHRERVTFGLSYDGLPVRQKENRGIDETNLDFFRDTWPNQTVKMTVNASSVPDVAEGVIWLLERGMKVNLGVAHEGQPWTEKDFALYQEQLRRLAAYYLSHPEMPMILQFQHNLLGYTSNLSRKLEQERSCGAGDGFWVYDVDGQRYPCHMLSPLVLKGEALSRLQQTDFQQITDFADPSCSDCPYTIDCPACMGCNYRYRGDIRFREITHCKVMQIEAQVFMEYETLRLSRKKQLTEEDILTIDAIAVLRRRLKERPVREWGNSKHNK